MSESETPPAAVEGAGAGTIERPEYTPTEMAYYAGFFDGEGCISFKTRRYKSAPQYVALVPVVTIAQVDPMVIVELYNRFGGYMYVKQSNSRNGRPAHYLELMALKAVAFIRAIYPYLRQKRQQADLVFEYIAIRPVGPGRHCVWQPGVREDLKARMHVLNKRGVA